MRQWIFGGSIILCAVFAAAFFLSLRFFSASDDAIDGVTITPSDGVSSLSREAGPPISPSPVGNAQVIASEDSPVNAAEPEEDAVSGKTPRSVVEQLKTAAALGIDVGVASNDGEPSAHYMDLLARAGKGESQAQLDVGVLMYECSGGMDSADCAGVPEARNDALEAWWGKAAESGVAEAQRRLADLHPYGSEENIHWNRMAAQQGDVTAQVALGRSLVESGNPDGLTESMVWLSIAADSGDASAQMLVGQLEGQLTSYQFQQAQFRLRELGYVAD